MPNTQNQNEETAALVKQLFIVISFTLKYIHNFDSLKAQLVSVYISYIVNSYTYISYIVNSYTLFVFLQMCFSFKNINSPKFKFFEKVLKKNFKYVQYVYCLNSQLEKSRMKDIQTTMFLLFNQCKSKAKILCNCRDSSKRRYVVPV